jgi:hypothetical protein
MKKLISMFTTERLKVAVFAAALFFGAAMVGQAIPSIVWVAAAPLENSSPLGDVRKNDPNELAMKDIKARLVGSYAVTGTDAKGRPYVGEHRVAIALAPSGALQLEWDNGKSAGVGEVVGSVLTVASWADGRTIILTMHINADGSLSGNWLRRTDRGNRGHGVLEEDPAVG